MLFFFSWPWCRVNNEYFWVPGKKTSFRLLDKSKNIKSQEKQLNFIFALIRGSLNVTPFNLVAILLVISEHSHIPSSYTVLQHIIYIYITVYIYILLYIYIFIFFTFQRSPMSCLKCRYKMAGVVWNSSFMFKLGHDGHLVSTFASLDVLGREKGKLEHQQPGLCFMCVPSVQLTNRLKWGYAVSKTYCHTFLFTSALHILHFSVVWWLE